METDRERAEPAERIGLRGDGSADVVAGLADGLLEQREHQLVLAVEVLVEAAQRLLRPVDDLLDREVGRAPLVDQLERGVEEALHPLLGPGSGRVHTPRDTARSRQAGSFVSGAASTPAIPTVPSLVGSPGYRESYSSPTRLLPTYYISARNAPE